jgi:chromosome segregation ATPase
MADDESATPPNVLDRKARAFQFRIQQTLSLRDEEIERLSTHLTTLKSTILLSKQRLRELDQEIQDASEYRRGDENRRQATRSAALARFKSSHHQSIQEMQQSQTGEIEHEQELFEQELEAISETGARKLDEAEADLDQAIAKFRGQLQGYQREAASIQEHEESVAADMLASIDTVGHDAIANLQDMIKQRNTERFQNLQGSRMKLASCVETLDTMGRSHSLAVADRRRALKEIEQRYETDLAKLEERHRPKLARLAQRLGDTQERTKTLLRAAHHLEHTNQRQLKATLKDLDAMKRKSEMLGEDEMVAPEDLQRVEGRKAELLRLQRLLSQKEVRLLEARQDNEALKKELWRVRHNLKFRSAARFGT